MSSINPESSRPRPPHAPRSDEAAEAGAPQSGPRRERRGAEPADGRPEQEAPFPRDEFRRGPRPFGPREPHRPPHGDRGLGEKALGAPTRPDPAAMAEQLFTKADTDGDGALTQAELTAFYQERATRRPERRPMPNAPADSLSVAEPLVQEAPAEQASSVSDILGSVVTGEVAEPPTAEETPEAYDAATLQLEVLSWLSSLLQDPQYASLTPEAQAQLQQAGQAVAALDPEDPAFSENLQALLQSYGLAE